MNNSYNRQKSYKAELRKVWEHPESVNVIHYSCETFYERKDGSSPRITSIAVRNLKSGQAKSFSIHKFAEIKRLPANELDAHYDELEKEMLFEYFAFVKSRTDTNWLHWNMRSEHFGFHALELRAKILGIPDSDIFIIQDEKKFDLARILVGIYGPSYTSLPRMPDLVEMNHLKSKEFQIGEKEASLFDERNYVALHQSTLSKVGAFSDIAALAYENKLKTRANLWDKNGASITGLIFAANEHPIIILITICVTIISVIALFWNLIG